MSNPLDNNSLSFFLNFRNEDSFGEIPITEVVKFDGATFIVEQDNERYGRDISFMNESIDLFFYKGFYDTTENSLMLPNGTLIFNLTMGFEFLLETREKHGFESDIIFGTRKNDIDFIFGNLDFEFSETDDYTFISCKVIQNVEKQIINRSNELTVDVFSSKDINGNEIEPLQAINFLQKAKPIINISKWIDLGNIENESFTNEIAVIFPSPNLTEHGISESLSIFEPIVTTGVLTEEIIRNKARIKAVDLLTNIDVSIKSTIQGYTFDSSPIQTERDIKGHCFVSSDGNFLSDLSNSIPFFDSGQIQANTSFDFSIEQTVNIDNIPVDSYLVCVYIITPEDTNPTTGAIVIQNMINDYVNVTATATAINTVIKGVRYIDLFKQCVKSISGFNVIAPRFDVGGEFCDQFVFSGNLIKNRDDLPFNTSFKYLVETLKEVNCDYQIINNIVYIGHFKDFYPNKEIGILLSLPDESTVKTFNNRFALNQLEYKYSNFEKDEEESNTVDSVHTYSQWSFPNKQVEKAKKIDLKQVRDPFKLQKTINEAIKTTTATENDDKTFLIDVVKLAPNSEANFTVSLSHNVNSDGNLQLLNDSSFSWSVLGFGVGSDFTIVNTSNSGTREVLEITDNILTLQGGVNSGQNILTEVSFFYTNVQYTNRTNENFTVINNLSNPDSFSNLKYTIKRNLKHWYSYFATVGKYVINEVFRNTEFTNNGELETQLDTETSLIIEKENVNIVDFGEPILSANLFRLKLIADYEEIVSILNAMNTINDDGTIGGFIRCLDNNGKVIKVYPKKLEYEPATETVSIDGEERNQSQFIEITSSNGIIYIDDVPYNIDSNLEWFEITNDYLIIYDNDSISITNPTNYQLIKINGLVCVDSVELSEKLMELI